MIRIPIYWDDLIEEKQNEIFEVLGDNGNYDMIPIATIYCCEEDESDE